MAHLSKNRFAALVIIALCSSMGLLAFFYFAVLQSIILGEYDWTRRLWQAD